MVEFSPKQMQVIERLFKAGFRPIAIPPYESALCMRKGDCAAVLAAVPNGGIKPQCKTEARLRRSVRLEKEGSGSNAGEIGRT